MGIGIRDPLLYEFKIEQYGFYQSGHLLIYFTCLYLLIMFQS